MGNKHSGATSKSPSAAFGRLRIDSPHRQSPRRHPRATTADLTGGQQGPGTSFTSLHDLHLGSIATEKSPLLLRKLESLPSTDSGIAAIPPPWWIVPALICALCYAFYNIFIKLGSASIHPILGGVILQFVAAILGTCLLTILLWKDGGAEDLDYDFDGIKWSVCAGIAVGLAEIVSFVVSGLGVPASKSIPVIIGGSVGCGVLLGLFLLREALGYRGWTGVVLIISGVALVGSDPIGAGAMH